MKNMLLVDLKCLKYFLLNLKQLLLLELNLGQMVSNSFLSNNSFHQNVLWYKLFRQIPFFQFSIPLSDGKSKILDFQQYNRCFQLVLKTK